MNRSASVCVRLIAGLILLAAPMAARAIDVGDSAPPLSVDRWVKGSAFKKFEPGKIYVVEFWATWCGPCRQSIPHLTQMQKKYGDKVVFVGVSDEEVKKIEPFVKEMGEKMGYTVVADDEARTSAAYMKAFGIEGIPHAFVVDGEGKLAWHCHPMDGLEKTLDQIIAGGFDRNAAREKLAKLVEKDREQRKLLAFSNAYLTQVSHGEINEGEARAAGKELEQKIKADPSVSNRIAWFILTGERIKFRDVELAVRLSKAAVDATGAKEADALDTYALALHDNEKLPEAIEAQKKAIEVCADDEMLSDLKKNLARYEGEAKTSK